ncbi:hypothetical protein [Wenjunlia tyrosinilytica]|uniref:hypothetical protein n=1 Tax=Wenjunlia tyrosinilytica TaxID=1544741 RepID=UPI00166AD203|nr:hypothetical protein [Wenjunlia tyrosinilytica]
MKDIEGVYEHVTPQMRQVRLAALEKRWTRASRARLRVAGWRRKKLISRFAPS